MEFPKTEEGYRIMSFAPREGTTLPAGDYTPVRTEIHKLGASVDIKLNDITISYGSGEEICLYKDVTYNFSADTNTHRM